MTCVWKNGNFRNVLDVGTGTGLFAESFSERGLEVSGLDANPEMLVAAHQFVPKGIFREGTAEALPYPDSSFDLVFLGLVLHESDEPLKTLKEARRVARKRVCILEWPVSGRSLRSAARPSFKARELLIDLFKKPAFRKWETWELPNTRLLPASKCK